MRRTSRPLLFTTTLALTLPLAACNNAGEGALSGAAIGALSGLAIGAITGNAGTGAAIGAIGGAVAGGVIGDQNQRRDRESERPVYTPPPSDHAPPPPPPPRPVADADLERQKLGAFRGDWDVSGWIIRDDGTRADLDGAAFAQVEQNYFVTIDFTDMSADDRAEVTSGSSTLAYEPGVGFTMVNRFSSNPAPLYFVGEASEDGTRFTFIETISRTNRTPRSYDARKLEITFFGRETWDAKVYQREETGDRLIESLTMRRR